MARANADSFSAIAGQRTATNKAEFHRNVKALRTAAEKEQALSLICKDKSDGDVAQHASAITRLLAECANLRLCAATAGLWTFITGIDAIQATLVEARGKLDTEIKGRAARLGSGGKRLTPTVFAAQKVIVPILRKAIAGAPVVSNGITFDEGSAPAAYVMAKHVTQNSINGAPASVYIIWLIADGPSHLRLASSFSEDAYVDGTLEWVKTPVESVADAVRALCRADGITRDKPPGMPDMPDMMSALLAAGNVTSDLGKREKSR